MNYTIKITTLTVNNTTVNAMAFLPHAPAVKADRFAIFTHGYTSHKASILNWAARIAEENIPTIIFDQPGHFLGSFNEIESFESFKEVAPKLFTEAYEFLKEQFPTGGSSIVIGGHSLGALTALIALEENLLPAIAKKCICVGFGLPPEGVTHMFKTPFYKSTLHLRGQLVSEKIPPDLIFPWIKERKEELNLKKQRIHFITGVDDAVVGIDGTERIADFLRNLGNEVTVEKPKRLAHHLPELAAPHIKKFLKDQSFFLVSDD